MDSTIRYRELYSRCLGEPPRTLAEVEHSMPYFHVGILPGVCHQGQRKLFYSEIEFLTLVAKEEKTKDLSNFLIVYIGACPGDHLKPLMDIFKNTKWMLWDKNPSSVEDRKSMVRYVDYYMTDDNVQEAIDYARGREIIFITDIRVDTEEGAVVQDRHGSNAGAFV